MNLWCTKIINLITTKNRKKNINLTIQFYTWLSITIELLFYIENEF